MGWKVKEVEEGWKVRRGRVVEGERGGDNERGRKGEKERRVEREWGGESAHTALKALNM